MPVDVKFHTKALQYDRGQVVHGLTRSPVLDGLIARGHVEVLREIPDQPVEPPPAADGDDGDGAAQQAPEQELPAGDAPAPDAPRRGRKRADDADQ